MKKFFLILVILVCGCNKKTLTCYKKNYLIYGYENIYETYTFSNNNFINFSNIKKIVFDNNLNNYKNTVYNYLKEENSLIEELTLSKTSINNNNDYLEIKLNVNINKSRNLQKINLNKNLDINYIHKNLIEKGYTCEIES